MFLTSPTNARLGRGTGIEALATPGRAATLIALVSALIVAWFPLGLTSDYLNHLARNHIEAQIWFDTNLQQFYGLSFTIIPDLTMDMIVPWLSHLTGTYGAGAVTIWIAFMAPPLAGLLIAKNLHGRITWCSLAGFFAVFNANMQFGFVNFVASTGLALAGFALWINMAPRGKRAMVFAPFGAFLAFNHALGFLLFGYLVLLWELASFAAGKRGTRAQFGFQLITRDALTMLPGLLVIALATGNSQQLPHVSRTDFGIVQKLFALGSAPEFFNPLLGMLITLVFFGAVLLGLWRRMIAIEPRMVWVCVGVLMLVLAMPTSILGIWGLHFRFPAVFMILVAASLRMKDTLQPDRVRVVTILAAALLGLVFANAVSQMAAIDDRTRSLRALLAEMPEGSRVLPARSEDAEIFFSLHSAALAVIDRSAFVPNLFTNTSPVDVNPQMRPLHMPQAWPLFGQELVQAQDLELPASNNGHWSEHYYYSWPDHWDYVLYFRADRNERLNMASLCLIEERADFALYEISDRPCEKDVARTNATLRPLINAQR